MAAPTLVKSTWRDGNYGVTTFTATWAATDNYADEVLLDASALELSMIVPLSVYVNCSPGISLIVEIDSGTDELVLGCALGALISQLDFSKELATKNGMTKQIGGGTGDIVLTTASAAIGDEIYGMIAWRGVS